MKRPSKKKSKVVLCSHFPNHVASFLSVFIVGLGQRSLAQIDGLPESERILPRQQETSFRRLGVIEFVSIVKVKLMRSKNNFATQEKLHRRIFEYVIHQKNKKKSYSRICCSSHTLDTVGSVRFFGRIWSKNGRGTLADSGKRPILSLFL